MDSLLHKLQDVFNLLPLDISLHLPSSSARHGKENPDTTTSPQFPVSAGVVPYQLLLPLHQGYRPRHEDLAEAALAHANFFYILYPIMSFTSLHMQKMASNMLFPFTTRDVQSPPFLPPSSPEPLISSLGSPTSPSHSKRSTKYQTCFLPLPNPTFFLPLEPPSQLPRSGSLTPSLLHVREARTLVPHNLLMKKSTPTRRSSSR